MSEVFDEETHRKLLARIPERTGRDVTDWIRVMDDGPAFSRIDDKVGWLRDEHQLAYGHAKAIVLERDRRRARAARRY